MAAYKINSVNEEKSQGEQKQDKNKENSKKTVSFAFLSGQLRNVSDPDWWFSFIALTVCAFVTRLSYLDHLHGTTWDEVHFGSFANKYINRTFYHDVHPPLGKIFVAAASFITGYKGNFNFSAGAVYDDTIRYQLIRSEMAILGALLVPVAFLTVYELTRSTGASTVAALGVLCDTFLHKITTLILLDPPMIFSISICVLAAVKVDSHKERPWSVKWWCWLMLTGIGLGVVMSIKYVGIFTVLFVGLHTAYQLASLACDPKTPVWEVIPHFFARVLCLICLPVAVYLSTFVLHFVILTESGPEAGIFLHTKFYATLNNTEYDNKIFPKYVNYGANITIMSSAPPSAYLDSWFDLFPSDLTAPCQVVSTMTGRDPEGTVWRMRRVDIEKGIVLEGTVPTEPPVLVRNGDFVMLTHLGSERSLRSHNHRAPLTRRLFQVCTYGEKGQGGPFETWKVIIPGASEGEALRTIEHDFMLKHFTMNCYLRSSDVSLPKDWASEGSKEVACTKNPAHSNLHWHINWIDSSKVVGETSAKEHQFGLWERIVRLHESMFVINSGLRNDPKNVDPLFSSTTAWMWPVVFRMQLLAGYEGDDVIGKGEKNATATFAVAGHNPVVAYTNILSFGLVAVLGCLHLYKLLRAADEQPHSVERRHNTLKACLWLVLCWGVHYLPFFFMGRTLYVHHYCPAYLYSCMVTGVILQYFCDVVAEFVRNHWYKLKLESIHLLMLPSFAFLLSYVWLYPLATYVEGPAFKPVPRVNTLLQWLNFGQPWLEFGFEMENIESLVVSTKIPNIATENYENPYLNATLYYETPLNTTQSPQGVLISPTSVLNYSISVNFTSELNEVKNRKNRGPLYQNDSDSLPQNINKDDKMKI